MNKLTCPKCGSHDIRLCEMTPTEYRYVGVNEDGKHVFDPEPIDYADAAEYEDEPFRCGSCEHQWSDEAAAIDWGCSAELEVD